MREQPRNPEALIVEFGNGVRPRAVIEVEKRPKGAALESLRDSIAKCHQGPESANYFVGAGNKFKVPR